MATSPDYLRLASTATRSLIDTAFDNLREGVVIIDARQKHFPVVLTNAAPRRYLLGDFDAAWLIDSLLYALLALVADSILATVAVGALPVGRTLAWRFAAGECDVSTELKLRASALAARSRDLYGLYVHFRAEIWPVLTSSEGSASHLYRIAQEALTNASRHGHAAAVDIFLLVTKNTFLLRITDDGAGIVPSSKPVAGTGLKIMQYRASTIGAKFEIAPKELHGTVVRVTGDQPLAMSQLQTAHAI